MRNYCCGLGKMATCLLCLFLVTGCAGMDKATTGAAAGAGIGALAGQLIGHNTAGTLIGAGVGMGVGYIIGNEMDKQKAAKQQNVAEDETKPLADTTWQIIKVTPKPKHKDPYTSRVSHFKTDGPHEAGRDGGNDERALSHCRLHPHHQSRQFYYQCPLPDRRPADGYGYRGV